MVGVWRFVADGFWLMVGGVVDGLVVFACCMVMSVDGLMGWWCLLMGWWRCMMCNECWLLFVDGVVGVWRFVADGLWLVVGGVCVMCDGCRALVDG